MESDLEQIVKMIWMHQHKNSIQKDLLKIFLNNKLKKNYQTFTEFATIYSRCIVLIASEQLIGFAVVK